MGEVPSLKEPSEGPRNATRGQQEHRRRAWNRWSAGPVKGSEESELGCKRPVPGTA